MNKIKSFVKGFGSGLVSTVKFIGWFIKFIFTKEGAKKTSFVTGLGIAVGFCLLQIELVGFQTAVQLLEPITVEQLNYPEVNVPHPETTVEKMIKWTFGKDAKMALAISQAENGTRACDRVSKPNKDGSVDIGLFQVNNLAHRGKATEKELKDCATNIRVAYAIFKKQGNWSAWVAYKNGSYKKFLN